MTSVLYPRLPPSTANAILRRHRTRDIAELYAVADVAHPDALYAATGGDPAAPEFLQNIADLLRTTAAEYGYPRSTDDTARVPSDRAFARVLHQNMSIAPVEAGAADVWTFIAVQLVPDIVAWRFPASQDDERWICSDITRHVFGRLWWRAYVLAEPVVNGWDYSLLDSLTESDLNQIFERRSIGGRPPLARAIARAITDPACAPSTLPRRRIIRDVTRRIRRLLPFTAFLAIDEVILRQRVDDLVAQSVQAFLAADEASS